MNYDEYEDYFVVNDKVDEYVKRLMKEHNISNSHYSYLIDKIKSIANYTNNILILNFYYNSTTKEKEMKEFVRRVNKTIDLINDKEEGLVMYEEMLSLDSDECFNDEIEKKIEKEKSYESKHSKEYLMKEYLMFINEIRNGEYCGIVGKSIVPFKGKIKIDKQTEKQKERQTEKQTKQTVKHKH